MTFRLMYCIASGSLAKRELDNLVNIYYMRMKNELKFHDILCYFLRCLFAKGPPLYNSPPKKIEGSYNATLQVSGCS